MGPVSKPVTSRTVATVAGFQFKATASSTTRACEARSSTRALYSTET